MSKYFRYMLLLLAAAVCSCGQDEDTGRNTGNGDGEAVYVGQQDYRKVVLGQQFTSVGCIGCPQLGAVIDGIVQDMPDALVPVAFHMDYASVADPMSISETSLFVRNYGIDALPRLILDMNDGAVALVSDGPAIISAVREIIDGTAAECGVAVETELNKESRVLKIRTRVASNVEARYKYNVFLVEDGITGSQAGVDGEYVHDNVVRAMLSLSSTGNNLNSKAPFAPGTEVTAEDEVTLDLSWNVDNLRVVAIALHTDDNGDTWKCANVNQCRCGESASYLYDSLR